MTRVLMFKIFSQQESAIREQLLNSFIPDDLCPLGADLFIEIPEQMYELGPKDTECSDKVAFFNFQILFLFSLSIELCIYVYNGVNVQVEPSLFTIDDDILPNKFEGQTDPGIELALVNPGLLSVGELLNAVSFSPFIVLFIQIYVHTYACRERHTSDIIS